MDDIRLQELLNIIRRNDERFLLEIYTYAAMLEKAIFNKNK